MRKTILLASLIFSSTLSADEFQSIDSIKQKVEQYTKKQLANSQFADATIELGAIDSRLKLKKCNKQNLTIFNPYHKSILSTSTFGVKCVDKTKSWTIYVPVKINVEAAVLSAAHYLPRNHKISHNDIQIQKRNIRTLRRGYFTEKQLVIGKIAKRNIGRGKIITSADLKPAKLVYKGQRVIITAIDDSIKVSMKGVAVSSGTLGDTIRVKNLSSSRIIEAKIVANGKVQVII